MPAQQNSDSETILSSLRQLTATTAATEEKVEVLHPLLKLLQSPDPTLSSYAKRLIELLTVYEARLASMERTMSDQEKALREQSKRLDTLLSILEAPAPE